MDRLDLIGTVALVSLMVALIAVFSVQYRPAERLSDGADSVPDSAASKTTVTALLRAYEKNSGEADRTFKNRTWEVSGTIVRIEENWLGCPVLRLKGDDPRAGEVCFILQRAEADEIGSLGDGDTISIRGIGQGRSPRYGVKFRHCTVVF